MSAQMVVHDKRYTLSDGFWLTFAVGIHLLLFLAPWQFHPAGPGSTASISVSLLVPARPRPITDTVKPTQVDPVPASREESGSAWQAVARSEREQAEADPGEPEDELPGTSAARLLDSASRVTWFPEMRPENRQLELFVPWTETGNRIQINPGKDHPPEAAGSARKHQVVDRWLAADGSHNVVINTAGGETLCGRMPRWDPLTPLVEHVMMYRSCGRAEPTFAMPDRYLLINRRSLTTNP